MLSWGVREHYLERNPLPDIQKLREIQWVGQRSTDEIVGKDRQVPLTNKAIEAIKAMPKASKYVFYHPETLTR